MVIVRRLLGGALALLVATLLLIGPATAERRIALVIGIDRYPALPAGAQLVKAVADARAMRDLLRGALRFDEVVYGENTSLAEARDLLLDFSAKISTGDLVLVFFAGHGMNVRLGNYLLPGDLPALRDVTSENQVRLEEESMVERSISEERIRELVTLAGAKTAIVVLDACRNNIFREALAAAGPRTRALAAASQIQGARPIERASIPGRTQFITLYSASPGQRALDTLGAADRHPNSPFTRVLVSRLLTPGVPIYEVLRGLRAEVARLASGAGHDQVPAIADEALEDVVLVGGPAAAKVATPPVPLPPASAPPAAPAVSPPAPVVSIRPPAPNAVANTPPVSPAPRNAAPSDWAGWRLVSRADARNSSRTAVSQWALAPNVKLIAASYRDNSLRIWSVETGQQLGVVSGGAEQQAGLAFHPAGKLLAGYAARGGGLTLWDVESRRLMYRIETGAEAIAAVGFSENGSTLVVRDRRGALRAFDLTTRQERVATPADSDVVQGPRNRVRPAVTVSVAIDTLRVARGQSNDVMLLRALPGGEWVSVGEDGLSFTGAKAALADMELLKARDRLPVTPEFIAGHYRPDGLRR